MSDTNGNKELSNIRYRADKICSDLDGLDIIDHGTIVMILGQYFDNRRAHFLKKQQEDELALRQAVEREAKFGVNPKTSLAFDS